MKKLIAVILSSIFIYSHAQTYNYPVGVAYDNTHDRYIVADLYANQLLTVTPPNAPAFFKQMPYSPRLVLIVGDTVYACASDYLYAYKLSNGDLALTEQLSSAGFSYACTDYKGNLYLHDNGNRIILKYNIYQRSFTTITYSSNYSLNDLVVDSFHNRIVLLSTSNGNLYGMGLNGGTITLLKATGLSSATSLSMNGEGSYFMSSSQNNNKGIFYIDSSLAGAIYRVIPYVNGQNAKDIFYNTINDTLAVPVPSQNYLGVNFYGFPKPKLLDDYVSVAISDTQTICVLQNDILDTSKTITLYSISTPQYGQVVITNNCIEYIADSAGFEQLEYTVCYLDTPPGCKTAKIFITNVTGTGNHNPVALDNSATAIQNTTVITDVTLNDADADEDSICITTLIGSSFFSIDSGDCYNIKFTSDSFFTGSDTCLYVICDNGTPVMCDTAALVVTVVFNSAFLPQASYEISYNNLNCYSLTTINTTVNDTGTARWAFYPYFNAPITLYGDTGYYLNMNMHGFYGMVCLFVSNQFGEDSVCNTHNFVCEYIEQLSANHIQTYPNPATDFLLVKADEKTLAITNPHAIEIYNTMGERINLATIENINNQTAINVSDLPSGVYLLCINASNRQHKLFSKFTIVR